MAMSTRQQLPVAEEAIGEFGTANVPVRLRNVWYRFFLALDGLLADFQNGVLSFTLDNGVTAAGANQSSAATPGTEWAVITGGAVNTGILIENFGPGTSSTVINRSGSSKKVYPPAGGQIDALGPNVAYPLADTKTQIFHQTDTNQWYSTQLG